MATIRVSSRAASTSSSLADRICRGASPDAAVVRASTSLNDWICCGTSSSKTSKSRAARSVTGLPSRPDTITSTRTKLMPAREVGCPPPGPDGARHPGGGGGPPRGGEGRGGAGNHPDEGEPVEQRCTSNPNVGHVSGSLNDSIG